VARPVKPSQVPIVEPTALAEPTTVEERVQPATPILASYSGPESVIAKIQAVFGEAAPTALCIAKAESGYRTDAVNHNSNGTYDLGIFQLNDVHGWSWATRMDPDQNIKLAYGIYQSWGNWSAWATHSKCGV
jgi:hypothetical protein